MTIRENVNLKRILFGLIMAPLYIISVATLGAYSYLCLAGPGRIANGLLALFCAVLGSAIIVAPWVVRKDGLRGHLKPLRLLLMLIMVWFVGYLMIDTAPPANDYTERDIISDTPEARACYQAILPLIGDDEKKVNIDRKRLLSVDFLNDIEDHENEVMNAWEAIGKERGIIEKLGEYDRIIAVDPDKTIRIDTPILNFTKLMNIQAIYLAYGALKIKKGDSREAIDQLSQLYEVARKGAKGSVILIHKLLWAGGVINKTTDGVYRISTMGYTDIKTKQRMRKKFSPLTKQDILMENTLIGEYLYGKSFIDEYIKPETFLDNFNTLGIIDKDSGSISKYVSMIVYACSFNKNKSKVEYKEYMDLLISGSKLNPPDLSLVGLWGEEYRQSPSLKGLSGWVLWNENETDWLRYIDRVNKIKIKSDLLTIHLYDITGESLILNDIYTGVPYVLRHENGVLSTPGKDGLFDTEDDVRLERKTEFLD